MMPVGTSAANRSRSHECGDIMRSIRSDRTAFTLMELLVVVAIIGILAALLLPVLSQSKARSRRTICLNNLKQINLAFQSYAGDNDDVLPAAPNTVAYTTFV